MTKKLQDILEGMEESGSSEQLGVADCLKTIAENGGEQATDRHILCCAGEMRDAAQSILDQMKRRKL